MRLPLNALAIFLLACGLVQASEKSYRFKFGPAGSAAPAEFRLVTDKDRYEPGRAGWLPGAALASADRPRGGALNHSFVYCYNSGRAGEGTFKLELPSGSYRAILLFQDLQYPRAETPFDVYADGAKKLAEIRVVGAVLKSFPVQVTDGALALRFVPSAVPKRYNFWLINALVIVPETQGEATESRLAHSLFEVRPLGDFTEVRPPQTAEPARPTAADAARGYQLWCHDYLDLVYPSTLPPAAPATPRLRAFVCPGQTTCLAFSVHALRDLGAPRVVVTPDGASRPRPETGVERVWVRPVREGSHGTKFINRPDALLPLAPVELMKYWRVDYQVGAGASQTYWLTISAPAGVPAGIYRATVEFRPAAAPAERVPLAIAVLPFSLAPPPQYSGVYWYRDLMPFPELADKDLANMQRHGVRAVAITAPLNVSVVAAKVRVDCEALCQQLAMIQRHGLTGPIPCFDGHLTSAIGSLRPKDAGFDDLLAAAVAAVEKEIRERRLPRVLWYPVDEPANSPEGLSAARRWLAVIKRVPGALTYCTPNSPAAVHQLGSLMDVACIQQLSVNPQTMAAVRQHGGTVYFYTSAYDGDRLPDRLRFLNGLFLFKSGATAVFYWHYQYPVGDPLNDLDGATCDYNLCHPSQAGPVATLGWEAIREGNNDVAYLHGLTHWIAAARSSGNSEAQGVAARAQQWLDAAIADVAVDGAQVHKTLSPLVAHRTFDQHRMRAADFTIRILQALGKLSAAERQAAEAFRRAFGDL